MNHNKTIISAIRMATQSKWMWTARVGVVIIAIAFMVTGCGSGTHPH